MRFILIILILFANIAPLKSQEIQLTNIGAASWQKISGKLERDTLAVIKKILPFKKVTTTDQLTNIFKRRIDPGTITLHLGATKPVLNEIQIKGIPLPTPIIIAAPPLQTRDNISFNINYTDKKHGYAATYAMDFAEDDVHNIWIASEKGLIRYDGFHYYLYEKKINFPDLLDGSLAYDNQKRLWAATENGIYFIKNDSLFTLQCPAIDLSDIACKKIYVDKYQRVWIATKNYGALCIEGSTLKIYNIKCGLPGNYIESIYLDKKDRLLLACRDYGIVIIEPDKIRMFFSKATSMKYHTFLSFYEDEDGIWTGSFLSGFMRMGSSDTVQYSITDKFNEAIYDIKKAPGGIWLSCYSNALCYFSKDKLLFINNTNGLLNNLPYRIFNDSYQNLWVSNSAGFSRINENYFYLDGFQNPALGSIRKVITDESKGGNWLITFGRNLQFQKGKEVTSYIYKTPLGVQSFLYCNDGVLTKDGSIWMGIFGEGIVKADEKSFTQYSYSNFTDYNLVNTVVKDSAENIWFCPTKFGLIEYDNKQFWHYTNKSGFLSNDVTNLFKDAENKILWTFPNGFQRFNGSAIETFYIGNHPFKDQINGLLDLDAKTRILATNSSGVLLIHNNQAYQFSTATGLSSNTIKTIIRDTTGKIWISTENGIESFFVKNQSITEHRIYNQINGAFLIDAENVLLDSKGFPYWIVGPKKLVINTDAITSKIKIPVFSFREIEIDNQLLLPKHKIAIFPNQKITINYNTIDWGRENNLKLSYLLISNKKDTTERSVQNSGSIIINDVLPGHYRILLKATDNNDVFYSKSINFTVNEFWFNTWTFRILLGLLILSSVYFYFRQKAKRHLILNEQLQIKVHEQTALIEKEKDALLVSYHTIDTQNKEKDVLIDEINHRVKNNLQFIAAILELQLDNQVSSDVIRALLETSRRIKAMSLVHELLYTKQEQKGLSMQLYIRELVDNLVEMAVDDTSPVTIDMDIEDLDMDSKTALALGMIISELVSNSIKHAFENILNPEIRIQLNKVPDSDMLRLSVSDNGTGFQIQPEFPNGLGSSLVDIFSRQLDGTYTKQTEGFFHYELLFKLNNK